jgi:peptidoglycan/xylan/chitin deacetylase (PgdA/CDA1 family)
MRQFLQRLWVAVLYLSGALWWARRQLRREGAVVVLVLHRVLDEAEWRQTHSPGSTVVRSRTFLELAEYLARRCQPVPLSEAEPGTVGRRVKIAITFDGAWCDNYTIALPVALACGLSPAVFVCTGLTGCIAPFWPERMTAALRAMRPSAPYAATETLIEHLSDYTPQERARWLEGLAQMLGKTEASGEPFEGDSTMTWEEIAEMDQAGVAFGSHTHTHQVLPAVGKGVARREVRDSQAALERRLRKRCELFAYPASGWSEEARRIVEEQGFRLAFTSERSAWTADCDRLRIPRANVCESEVAGLRGRFSPAMFEYATFWKVWRAMRSKARPRTAERERPAERAAA